MLSVKRLRIERGMSRKELANKVNISPAHLGCIERGERKAPVRLMAQLAKELGAPVEKLVVKKGGWFSESGL
jgi:transcriptional regulator with XRE-family HTH domain